MNRAAALTYLTNEFADLATDSGLISGDLTTAYNTAIDNSLRQLGYVEADLSTADVIQTDITKYLALLEYFALKRFARLLSTRVSVSLPGPASAQRNQAFDQVQKLLATARADLADLGIDPGGASSFEFGRINLDFLEPSLEVM